MRPARPEDGRALADLDALTWNSRTSPAPTPPAGSPFFEAGRSEVADVIVAEADGAVVGYVRLGRATPLEASDHVRTITGIAVHPSQQRRGIGRLLLDAAAREAARRGATRLTLRVLADNAGARRLYEEAGFVVEGVMRGEFRLDGRVVDDVFMALDVSSAA